MGKGMGLKFWEEIEIVVIDRIVLEVLKVLFSFLRKKRLIMMMMMTTTIIIMNI